MNELHLTEFMRRAGILSPATIRRAIRAGKIRSRKGPNKRVLIPESELAFFVGGAE